MPAPEPKPKVEVFLTGITSIGHPKLPRQAYFYTREQGKKEVTYYALTEGSGKDGIEVLDIDPEKRKVRIKMESAETLLSFETHGVPIAAVPAVGRPLPGVPGSPNLPVPGQPGQYVQPGAQPLPSPGTSPNYRGQPGYNSGANIPQPMDTTMNQGSTGLRQIPSRRLRGSGGNRYGGAAVNGAPVPDAMGVDAGGGQHQQAATDPAEEYVRAHLNQVARQREQPNIPLPPLPTVQ
jgi:hypothetical protein